MADIPQYLLSIVAAAIISGLVITMTNRKGATSAIIRLIIGLFLVMSVVSPWMKLRILDLPGFFSDIQLDGKSVSADALAATVAERNIIIKEKMEAYILEKAAVLDLSVKVSVTLTETDPPTPCDVKIIGNASPYAKHRLQNIISNDLGVPKEQQLWM